jgi:hypothetical protein
MGLAVTLPRIKLPPPSPLYALNMRLDGWQGVRGRLKKITSAGNRTPDRPPRCTSHCTSWAIAASRFSVKSATDSAVYDACSAVKQALYCFESQLSFIAQTFSHWSQYKVVDPLVVFYSTRRFLLKHFNSILPPTSWSLKQSLEVRPRDPLYCNLSLCAGVSYLSDI